MTDDLADLEGFTLSTFAGHLGEKFRVQLDDTRVVEVELLQATGLGGHSSPPDATAQVGAEQSFSLLFRGPREPALYQGTYEFHHDEIGAFALSTSSRPSTTRAGRSAALNKRRKAVTWPCLLWKADQVSRS